MVVSRFRIYARGYGDLTLGGAELEEVKSLRILGVCFGSKLTLRTYCAKLCRRQLEALVPCAGQESYMIDNVWSRMISMHMFCLIWSIVPPCGCCLRSLI